MIQICNALATKDIEIANCTDYAIFGCELVFFWFKVKDQLKIAFVFQFRFDIVQKFMFSD